MEKFEGHEEQNQTMSYQESFNIARDIFDSHRQEIILSENENFGRRDLPDFINKIPEEIREKFTGHGIKKQGPKMSEYDLLAAFINIVANKSIKGDYGPLSGGQFGAWTNSDFFILSKYNISLGKPDVSGRGLESDEIGWKADVGAFVVCNHYYPIMDDLKKMFPDENIIRADELPNYIKSQISN